MSALDGVPATIAAASRAADCSEVVTGTDKKGAESGVQGVGATDAYKEKGERGRRKKHTLSPCVPVPPRPTPHGPRPTPHALSTQARSTDSPAQTPGRSRRYQ